MFSSVPLVPLDAAEQETWTKKGLKSKLRAPVVPSKTSDPATSPIGPANIEEWVIAFRNGVREDIRALLGSMGNPTADIAFAPLVQTAESLQRAPVLPPECSTVRSSSRGKSRRSNRRKPTLSYRSSAADDIMQMLAPEEDRRDVRRETLDKQAEEAAKVKSSVRNLQKRMSDQGVGANEASRELPPESESWGPSKGLSAEPADEKEPLVPTSGAIPLVDGDMGLADALDAYAKDQAQQVSRARAPVVTFFNDLVSRRQWELGVGILIVLNAIWVGITVETQCRLYPTPPPRQLQYIDATFVFVFACEIAARLIANAGIVAFFAHPVDMWWNTFDAFVVAVSSADLVDGFLNDNSMSNWSGARALRLLRFARVARFMRIVRVFRVVQELRAVVSSALSSLRALVWTLMLMFLMIYVVALCMTQIFLESRPTARDDTYIELWWGSLFRTLLTLFQCITSGTTWDKLLRPLSDDLGPLAGFAFILYIAFCVIALLNVITGVFVEKALENAEHHKVEFLRDRICDAFRRIIGADGGTSITADKFDQMVNSEEMQEYFKIIDVDTSDSNTIFQILDADKSGSIDVVELITGCMRLRGPAQALHLEMLMFECKSREDMILSVANRIGRQVETLLAKTEGFTQARHSAMAIENAAPETV